MKGGTNLDLQREMNKLNKGLQEIRQDLNDIVEWCEEHDQKHRRDQFKQDNDNRRAEQRNQNQVNRQRNIQDLNQNQGKRQGCQCGRTDCSCKGTPLNHVDTFRHETTFIRDNCFLPTQIGPQFCDPRFRLRLAGLNNGLNFQLVRGIGCKVEIELDGAVDPDAVEPEEPDVDAEEEEGAGGGGQGRGRGRGQGRNRRRNQRGRQGGNEGAEEERANQNRNVVRGVICNAGTNFVDIRLKSHKVVTILTTNIRKIKWIDKHCNPCDQHLHHFGVSPFGFHHNQFGLNQFGLNQFGHHQFGLFTNGLMSPFSSQRHFGACGVSTCRICHPHGL